MDQTIPKPELVRITSIGQLISSLFALVLVIAGFLSFGSLILGGLQWIVSGGNKESLHAARNRIIHSILGLIFVVSTWGIMLFVQQFLGITILGTINLPLPR